MATEFKRMFMRRGSQAEIQEIILSSGEFGLALDTGKVFIGNGASNILLNPDNYVPIAFQRYSFPTRTAAGSGVADTMQAFGTAITNNIVVQRDSNGFILIKDGTASNHPVTKSQLDTINTSLTTSINSVNTTLGNRITNLDTKVTGIDNRLTPAVSSLDTELSTHTSNTGIHVTATQKNAWNTHVADNDIHVTLNQKNAWNAHIAAASIHVTQDQKNAWDNHVANGDIHVTSTQKSSWSNHVGNGDIHVTKTQKDTWNSHVDNTTVHITSAERTAWNNKQNALGFTPVNNDNVYAVYTTTNVSNGIYNLSYINNRLNSNQVTIGAGTIGYPNSVAIGNEAVVTGSKSVAIGSKATARTGSTSLGAESKSGTMGIVIGGGSSAVNGSIIIGNNQRIENEEDYDEAILIGKRNTSKEVYGSQVVLIGGNNYIQGSRGIAIGNNLKVDGVGGIAIGNDSQSDIGGISIGKNTETGGSNNLAIGNESQAYGTSNSSIGYLSVTNSLSPNTMQLGSNTSLATLKARVQLTVTSDIRDKADIKELPQSKDLDFISRITPIEYVYNERTKYISDEQKETEDFKKYGIVKDYDRKAHAKGTKKGKRLRVGVKAQEVQEAMKEVFGHANYHVVNNNFHDLKDVPEDIENQLTVAYADLVPFLIGAVKELKQQLDILRKEVIK